MRRSLALSPITSLLAAVTFFTSASAERLITSSSLNPCQDNSSFSATLFNVAFTPDNKTVNIEMKGVSSISEYVGIKLDLIVYGYNAIASDIDPCTTEELKGLCPMNTGNIDLPFNLPLSDDVIGKIPGTFPIAGAC